MLLPLMQLCSHQLTSMYESKMLCNMFYRSYRSDYLKGVEKIESLKVINDFAERGVALVQSYNKLLTKDEDEFQFYFKS